MRVRVKYFALHRDLVGKANEEFQLDEDATIDELLSRLTSLYLRLTDAEVSTLISLNGESVDKSARLKNGDTVAIFLL